MLDPERFEDDDKEPMTQRGMGVIYTLTTQQKPLRRKLSPEERLALLDKFYHPHHARLTAAVDNALETHGRCLLVDAHSFPSVPLPYELDQSPERPDFCLGTDPFHTSTELESVAAEVFLKAGYSVEINRPFSGTLVPMAHYRVDPRVTSIMIEVNRRLYLDPPTQGIKGPRFAETKQIVQECISQLIAWNKGS